MRKLRLFLPIVFVISALCGLIYVSVQQALRQTANDPQIQIARDSSQLLEQGKTPQDIIPSSQVDLSKSLNTFIIIFNDAGKPIASQAVLDGRVPTPPQGVFDYTKTNKEDRVTWQPKENVIIASVVERFEGSNPGFILSGRSLEETEKRVSALGQRLLAGWLVSIIGSLVLILLFA